MGYTNQLNFFVPSTLNQGYPAKLGWQFAKSDNFPAVQITGYNQGCNGGTALCVQINAVYKEHAYDPSDVVSERFFEAVFGEHPLGRAVIGRAEVVRAVDSEQLRAFHAERYRPGFHAVGIENLQSRLLDIAQNRGRTAIQ